ncbi:MAG TPA: acyl-CoA reductase [Candidatus Binataceae bacterium]|nr:acyl-CoA reductase [Candidatus Binataceae bacterium]
MPSSDDTHPESVYMTTHAQVLDFIRNPDPTRFERLALAVFARQFELVQPYREYCLSRGVSLARVRSVAAIPPVSTAAFKYVVFSSGPPQRIFLTSGTSRGREERGRHFVADLEHYRLSAMTHLERMLFPDRRRLRMLALHPTVDRMPESSLSQMISWCVETFGAGPSLCCASPMGVETGPALDFLRAAEVAGEAVCILGTTAATAALFEHLRTSGVRLKLPAGSRLMDTGGAKGQLNPMEPAEVVASAQLYLGIAPHCVINEYGMTELCSQLYDATPFNCPEMDLAGDRVKIAPPWLKVIVRDPVSLLPVAAGQTGLLSFFDLANAGSVSALLTEDLGSVAADGAVRIFGRVIGADPRGCALGIEQFTAPGERAARPHGAARLLHIAAQPVSITGAGQADLIESCAASLRRQADRPLAPLRIADTLARACGQWREPGFAARRATLAATAEASDQTQPLLASSLDALLGSFTRDAMLDLARRLSARDRLIGLIMPGNVMGAGLHELVQALIGGAAVIVKAASGEPLFFAEFQRTLAAIDAEVAARMQVLVWNRLDRESTAALVRECDRVAAFGEDQTIAALAQAAGPKLVGFGSRLSGAVVAREAACGSGAQSLAAALARDVTLFDQRGCLSLHHIFVEASRPDAQIFAESLARELAALARLLPPPARLTPVDTVAARGARENVRWRAIGGVPLALWEGAHLGWTVIFDPDADFQAAPLCRTVRVSAFDSPGDLRRRLAPATGSLEGFALADPAARLGCRELLGELGVSYICAPGMLQSPPPSWAHGGGRFLKLMEPADG